MVAKRAGRYWFVWLAALLGVGLAFLHPAPETAVSPAHTGSQQQTEAARGTPIIAPVGDSAPPAWDTSKPVALPVRRGTDGVSIVPAALAFADMGDGQFEVRAPRYQASLTAAQGLTYRPLPPRPVASAPPVAPPLTATAPTLRVRLSRVARGADALYDCSSDADAGDDIAVSDDDGLSFWRAPGFEEHYLPRGDGVEQSFVLESRPEGRGPLTFVCELELRGLTPLPPRAGRRGGIFFVDANGAFAARYGQVMVRDSSLARLVLEPALAADGRSVSFAVPAKWLEAARYPVVVDPLVGGDFQISSDNPVGVTQPTVAAGNNSFLVVWNDYRAGSSYPQLVASIVSQSGLASPEFAVSSGMGFPRDFRNQRIEAAFDGSNWLLVWSDDRAVGPGIRGCIISSLGAILDGNDFLIASTPGTVSEDPLVAFNGLDFVVAWQSPPTGAAGSSEIYYTRVTSAKVVDTPVALPAATTPFNQALLFLAPQKPSGDTLLVYRDNGESPPATRGVRIAADASLRDAGGTVLFKQNVTDGGFGQPLGVAFVDTAWHILSSFDQVEDSSVYLHKLDTAGVVTPPQGVFATMGLGPTGSAADSCAPAFAGAGEWLFVRNEKITNTVYHVLGKRVTFAGEDKDPIPFQIDNATQGVLRNAVAAQSGNVFLTVWLDGRRSTTQPADSRNIFGALVDATLAGTSGIPLVAVATASPSSGEAPLSVLFDSSASTGGADTLSWDFGDGTSATEAAPTHIYRNNGTYAAQLKLTKGAYTVFDTVLIVVGGGGTPGPGGGTVVGLPWPSTPGMEPRLFISSATFKLDFVNTASDAVRVTGIVDTGQLTSSLTGVTASVSFGWQSYAFNLDASGAYKSDANATPILDFVLDQASGSFLFQATNASLATALDALGAKKETVKPARTLDIPITVTIDKFSATADIGVSYKATQGVSGTGTYAYLGVGAEISGSFLITKFVATEQTQGKTGLKVHNFSVKGQLKRPNGGNFSASPTGAYMFEIGSFVVSIPGGQFRMDAGGKKDDSLLGVLLPYGVVGQSQQSGGNLKFVGRGSVSGLKKFSVNPASGQFNLQMVKVPAEGVGGSGMPVANSGTDVVKVDLNLSFQFDLADGSRFSSGRYIYCARKNAASKGWKLR